MYFEKYFSWILLYLQVCLVHSFRIVCITKHRLRRIRAITAGITATIAKATTDIVSSVVAAATTGFLARLGDGTENTTYRFCEILSVPL